MHPIPDHVREMFNEINATIEAHDPDGLYGKIDWSNFLTLLTRLIELLAPIIIPLLIKPVTPDDPQK